MQEGGKGKEEGRKLGEGVYGNTGDILAVFAGHREKTSSTMAGSHVDCYSKLVDGLIIPSYRTYRTVSTGPQLFSGGLI